MTATNLYNYLLPLGKYDFVTTSRTYENKTLHDFNQIARDKNDDLTQINQNKAFIWKANSGWNFTFYQDTVKQLIALIDAKQLSSFNHEFITSVYHQNQSIFSAVKTWFDGSDISICECSHHKSGNGHLDFAIHGLANICRAVLPMNINSGDFFNIYTIDSSKFGCIWHSDLKTSILKMGLKN